MTGDVLYLDASALVKLIRVEPETRALQTEVQRWRGQVTSVVGDVESRRAARRAGVPAEVADGVLDAVSLVELDDDVRRLAAELEPPELRALDALHLASALTLGEELGALACYDERLAEGARRKGVRVVAPT